MTTQSQAIASKHLRSRIGLTARIALIAPVAAEIKRHQGCSQDEAEEEACSLLGIAYEGSPWKHSAAATKYTAT